jgi:hypothetical protein
MFGSAYHIHMMEVIVRIIVSMMAVGVRSSRAGSRISSSENDDTVHSTSK